MGLAVCIEDRGEAAVLLLFFMAGVEGMEGEDLNRDMIMWECRMALVERVGCDRRGNEEREKKKETL